MAPFDFDEDEWLAAQYLLFLDETEDEAEARRRVEQLRNERAAGGHAHPPFPPPILRQLPLSPEEEARFPSPSRALPPPPPPSPAPAPLWRRIWAWLQE